MLTSLFGNQQPTNFDNVTLGNAFESAAPPKKKKTVYDAGGSSHEVDEDFNATPWAPNTNYATGVMFGAPPPVGNTGFTGGRTGSSGSLGGIQQVTDYNQPQSAPNTSVESPGGPAFSNYTGAPTSPLDADRARLEMEGNLSAAADARHQAASSADLQARLKAAKEIMDGPMGSGGSSGPSGPAFDENAARAAAFARAKEQAGQTALASMKSLQNVMAGSGRMGSSLEASGISDVINGAGGKVDEYTRDQLMTDLNRAADVSDRNYAGGLTQRGQDVAMRQSLLGILNRTGGAY